MIARNNYAERARQKKVNALVFLIDSKALENGLNPHKPDVVTGIIEQLVSAPAEKRRGLAQEAHQNEFSDESWNDLVNVYRQRAGLPAVANDSLGGQSRATASGVAHQEGKQPQAGPAPAPGSLGPCRGCGKPRDDASDQWCRECQAREIAGVMVEQVRLPTPMERGPSQREAFIDGPSPTNSGESR